MTDPPGPHPGDPDAPERARLEFSRRLGYGDYLRLDTLLGAHQPLTDAHEEHLFITVHHVSELWLDLIIRELRMAMTQLAAGITPNCGEAQTNPTEGSSRTSRSCGDGRTSGALPDVREPKQFGITDAPLKGLTRVVRAQEQLTDAWEVLKTMTPADYLEYR